MSDTGKRIDGSRLMEFVRRFVLNKYAMVLLIFGFVFLFAGDQSIVNMIRRGHDIRVLEGQRDRYEEGVKAAQRDIETLQHTDSLERFAREHYYMHAPDEDVYLIDE